MPGMVCSNSASEGPVPGSLGGSSVVAARSTSSIALVRRASWLTSVRTDVSARGRRLATIERAPSAVADARGVVQRESAGARLRGRAATSGVGRPVRIDVLRVYTKNVGVHQFVPSFSTQDTSAGPL